MINHALRKQQRWNELLPDPAFHTYARVKWWSLGCLIGCAVLLLVGLVADLWLAVVLAAGTGVVVAAAVFLLSAGCLWGYIRGFKERELIESRSRIEADLRTWLDLPRAPDGHGHLYVIQFSNYVIKVGQTNHIARRLPEHRHDARTFDLTITKVWTSPAHADYLGNETRLLVAVAKMHDAGRAKREYFHDAEFDKVVTLAESLVGAAVPAT